MQKTYSVFFDYLETVNKELENLVSQGFRIVQFQVLHTTGQPDTAFNYYMAIVYEVKE